MDPITDMLNKIKNAQAVRHPTVDIPFSNLKAGIARLFKKHGFIAEIEKRKKMEKLILRLTLKYEDGKGTISGIRRISKPGQRIYSRNRNIKKVKGDYGISIISTTKGLMTNKEAKKKKLGGEVIAEIW